MPFDHDDHYHRLFPRQVPRGARRALDVRRGTGDRADPTAERAAAVPSPRESARRLARLGGTDPHAQAPPRRRFRSDRQVEDDVTDQGSASGS